MRYRNRAQRTEQGCPGWRALTCSRTYVLVAASSCVRSATDTTARNSVEISYECAASSNKSQFIFRRIYVRSGLALCYLIISGTRKVSS